MEEKEGFLLELTPREIALKLAWHWVGLWYTWGGDDPIAGFDCSGFVIEILKSVGLIPRKMDLSADGIYYHFRDLGVGTSKPGPCRLAFWKDAGAAKIRHVEFCIGGRYTIGASGGGSKVKTIEDAIKANAFIKVRPLNTHVGSGNSLMFVDPFLAPIVVR